MTPRARRRLLKEVAAIYLVAFVLVLAAALAAGQLPFIAQNLYAIVAGIFVLVPYGWLNRKRLDFTRFGLTTDRLGRGVLWGLGATAITLPLFAGGLFVWETSFQGRTLDFDLANYRKWPVELEGRPSHTGPDPGVWTWHAGGGLHVAVRAAPATTPDVVIEADRPFTLHMTGPGYVRPDDGEPRDPTRYRFQGDSARTLPGESRVWRLTPGRGGGLTTFALQPRDGELLSRIHVRTTASTSYPDSADTLPIYLGRHGVAADGPLDAGRGTTWLWLWALTHLLFIALPEEYFYRGYLQTRLAEAFGEAGDGRPWWRPSRANLTASALFAAGHLFIPVGGVLLATRATVFFPSLVFGWLRERTGTITAPVIYHAACNMMVIVAAPHFV